MGGIPIHGLEEFRKNVDELLRRHRRRALDAMNAIGDAALLEAVEHAPLDKGDLQDSIKKSIQITPDDAIHAVIRVSMNATAADYAIAMHEDNYTPGPDSVKKGAKNGRPVGRKYIVNGCRRAAKHFKNIIKERMKP